MSTWSTLRAASVPWKSVCFGRYARTSFSCALLSTCNQRSVRQAQKIANIVEKKRLKPVAVCCRACAAASHRIQGDALAAV